MPRKTGLPKDSQVTECICEGNWRSLIKEYGPLIDRWFVDNRGQKWRFYGLVWGSDDFYYGMWRKDKVTLLSCVGSIEGHGFEEEE